MPLQLCRPLSGAVIVVAICGPPAIDIELQLCRPLSGAVISTPGRYQGRRKAASIVPPPFGSGYDHPIYACEPPTWASIVPPPFGSGYDSRVAAAGSSGPGFNCAAPFRERLYRIPGCGIGGRDAASIVPPPFGSGYADSRTPASPLRRGLQLCRPLSGAVMQCQHIKSRPPS